MHSENRILLVVHRARYMAVIRESYNNACRASCTYPFVVHRAKVLERKYTESQFSGRLCVYCLPKTLHGARFTTSIILTFTDHGHKFTLHGAQQAKFGFHDARQAFFLTFTDHGHIPCTVHDKQNSLSR